MALPTPGWNVVFGEIPAASKWTQLGQNDDALAAGTGFNAGAIPTAALADGAATPRKSGLLYDAAYYAATGQAIAASRTGFTLGASETNPTLVLPTKTLLLVMAAGNFNTSATNMYPHINLQVSTDNATWRDFTSAEQALAGTNSVVTMNSFNNISTLEQAGPISICFPVVLAAGTYYFTLCHTAGLATGSISYGAKLSAIALSFST